MKKSMYLIIIPLLIAASYLVGILVQRSPLGFTGKPERHYVPLPTVPPTSVSPEFKGEGGYVSEDVLTERKIIYSAEVEVEVDDAKSSFSRVRDKVEALNGYVASVTSSEVGYKWFRITVRVPVGSFQDFLEWCDDIGKVEKMDVSSEDVTMEYIDLQARLENLKATEKRYLEILNMSKTVDEVLKVEAELSRIRGDIESLEGKIRYLERTSEMSRVVLYLHEPSRPMSIMPTFDWREVLRSAFNIFVNVISGLIVLTFALVPIGLFLLLIYLIYGKLRVKLKLS